MAVIRFLVLFLLCCGVASSQIYLPGGVSDGRGIGTNSNFTTTSTFSALATVPAGVRAIYVDQVVAGYNCPLTYNRGGSTPTGGYGELHVGGVYWEPRFDTSPVKACQFGTVADGVPNLASNAPPTGTDNTPMIQNALDYAMRNNFQTVCLNDGNYKTTDTLAMGWGNNFYTLSLQACNAGRGTYSSINYGVTILPTKTDRCTINIAGGRFSSVKYLQIIGSNYSFTNSLFSTLPVPTTAAGWLDPGITPGGSSPGGLQQNSPYGAICVDAYGGSPPAIPYPNQTFPSWTGVVSQYHQSVSTNTLFDNLSILGFAVGINNSPNNQGNGDFTKLVNSVCINTVYCESIGNSQSRNVTLQNINCSNVYTVLTNDQFGNKNGELGGNIINVGCGQIYQLLDINLAIASTTVQDTYMESAIRLGAVTGAGSITFRNCLYGFSDTTTGQVPPAVVEAGNSGATFKFEDCKIANNSRISSLVHYTGGTGTVTFSGGSLNGGVLAGTLFNNAGAKNAVNYTGGYLAGAFTYPNTEFQNRLIWENQSVASFMSTNGGNPTLSGASWSAYPSVGSLTRALWSQAMSGFIDVGGEGNRWNFTRGPGNFTLDMTGALFTTALTSASCDTWTGQWQAGQQTSQNGNVQVGDIFYHQGTGTVWNVESIGGAPNPTNYDITLRQQNNMTVTNTGACSTNNLASIPSGNSRFIHVTAAIPGQVMYCNFVNGSTALSNCSRGDGVGTQMTNVLASGDKFWAGGFNDTSSLWPFPSNATLSSVTNGSPGSAVLSANANKTGRFPLLPFPTTVMIGQGQIANSQKNVTAPTGTTSTTAVMMGLAGTITPTITGRMLLIISGDITNGTANDGATVQCSYGTGTAPNNGDALTGTQVGGVINFLDAGVTNSKVPFSCQSVVTGLAINTAVWLDVALAAITGGTATIGHVSVSAHEF